MLRTPHRPNRLAPSVVLGCIGLSAPLAALPAPQAQLAADRVTIVTSPPTVSPAVPPGSTDTPTCADLVYFEDNGGADTPVALQKS
jgi:hypothetical protein